MGFHFTSCALLAANCLREFACILVPASRYWLTSTHEAFSLKARNSTKGRPLIIRRWHGSCGHFLSGLQLVFLLESVHGALLCQALRGLRRPCLLLKSVHGILLRLHLSGRALLPQSTLECADKILPQAGQGGRLRLDPCAALHHAVLAIRVARIPLLLMDSRKCANEALVRASQTYPCQGSQLEECTMRHEGARTCSRALSQSLVLGCQHYVSMASGGVVVP